MATDQDFVEIPREFEDIAPYTDADFKDKISKLVEEPGFREAIGFLMPQVSFEDFVRSLKSVDNQRDFQRVIMRGFLEILEKTSTHGISYDGIDNISRDCSYTFITNHRDIVLDASFLNLCFIRADFPVTQVAIGNNLLIYEWIKDLVKLNRSFIVKRDVKMKEALDAAKELSAYIHFTIGKRHESVWIAQREGRAKDSNDLTQESLVKMLALAGGADTKSNLLQVNLCPISISYEYDPNDFLKAREFLKRRRDPHFKKSKKDDLFSMQTGLTKQKGRVMFRIGRCINDELEAFAGTSRMDVIRHACQLVDRAIHCGYELYPCNFISYDEVNGTHRFSDRYTAHDVEVFDDYIEGQLDKVRLDDITAEERDFMRRMMLAMYANPLKNMLACKTVI